MVGENVEVGAGYNFTDLSDDLTDLKYDQVGVRQSRGDQVTGDPSQTTTIDN
jgi:hypothetical protein